MEIWFEVEGTMLFITSDKLKQGMRLAKPIYNRNGVLLYERNTKLTSQGIESVKNFGLIGLYILEPAEPVPPMSKGDIEFERFQTIAVFGVKDDMNFILHGKSPRNLSSMVNNIIKVYGRATGRINFTQNLRSADDYIYKHAVNMGILTALIANRAGMSLVEQSDIISAAMLHDIGKVNLPNHLKVKYGAYLEEDIPQVKKCQEDGINMLKEDFNLSQGMIKIVSQIYNAEFNGMTDKVSKAANIVLIADQFDTMTAMKLEQEPMSELAAIKHLLEDDKLDKEIVSYLVDSLDVLYPGVCVELTNGEKGLVIRANNEDVLRPVVLGFEKNCIYDLSSASVYKSVHIADIMKTMDNRIKVDQSRLDEYMNK